MSLCFKVWSEILISHLLLPSFYSLWFSLFYGVHGFSTKLRLGGWGFFVLWMVTVFSYCLFSCYSVVLLTFWEGR